jgi:hypothetical protein
MLYTPLQYARQGNLEMEGQLQYYTGSMKVLIPISFFDDPPMEEEYPHWITSARHGGPQREWYKTDRWQERFVPSYTDISFVCTYSSEYKSGAMGTFTRPGSRMNELDVKILIDQSHLGLSIPLINMSFLGALFGHVIANIYTNCRVRVLMDHLGVWVNNAPLPLSMVGRLSSSKITGLATDTNNATAFNHVEEGQSLLSSVRTLLTTKYDTFLRQEAARSKQEEYLLTQQNRRNLAFAMAMADIFEMKQLLISSNNNAEWAGSDGAWSEEFFTIQEGSLQLALTSNIYVGCRGPTLGNLSTLLKKCKLYIQRIIFDPPGIVKGVGENCFYSCIRFFWDDVIRKYQLMNDNANVVQWSNDYDIFLECDEVVAIKYMVAISYKSLEDIITKRCPFPVIVTTVEKRHAGDLNNAPTAAKYCTYRTSYNMEYVGNNCPVLYLFLYPSNFLNEFSSESSYFMFYHCMVVDSVEFSDYGQCPICVNWFKFNSKHWRENCQQCEFCLRFFLDSSNHDFRCRINANRLNSFKAKKGRPGIFDVAIRADPLLTLKRYIWFADIEAFPDPITGNHTGDMVVLKVLHGQVYTYAGKMALPDFCQFLMKGGIVKGIVEIHNGGNYDFHLIIAALLQARLLGTKTQKKAYKGKECLNIMRRGQKIICVEIATHPWSIILRDSYAVISTSLERGAKDVGAPKEFQKGHFDHSKIKCWEDFYKHEKELKEYCWGDVRALEFMCEKFAEVLKNSHPKED